MFRRAATLVFVLLVATACGTTEMTPGSSTQPSASMDPELTAACDALPEVNELILATREAVEFLDTSSLDDPDWAMHEAQISSAIDDLNERLRPVALDQGAFGDWKNAVLVLVIHATELGTTTGQEHAIAVQEAVRGIAAAQRQSDEFSADC